MKRLLIVLTMVLSTAFGADRVPMEPAMEAGLKAYLGELCDQIIKMDLGSGTLKGTTDTQDSIFINANMARVLISSYRLTGNTVHLRESLRWCDRLHNQQQIVLTSELTEGGYWGDRGETGNIYFGDAGTATAALAIGYRHTDPKRQRVYMGALERYARFVRNGVAYDPQHKGREGSKGWVIESGPDSGSLGCGYFEGKLSPEPYTIATATTGVTFFSELYALTHDAKVKHTATNAVRWLVKERTPDGAIFCVLGGQKPYKLHWPLAYMTYVGEAWTAAHRLLDDPALRAEIAREVKPSIEWVLRQQRPDGTWGEPRSGDQQRSAGVVSFLTWYYGEVDKDPRVAEAVQKYFRFLLDPERGSACGAKEFVRATGFVGLAVSEALRPGVTF